MRTIVDLPKDQIEALDSYAKAKGISRAAAVRESVAAYLPSGKKKKRDANYWRNHPFFGSEKRPQGFDSVDYCRKIRAEWDREL